MWKHEWSERRSWAEVDLYIMRRLCFVTWAQWSRSSKLSSLRKVWLLYPRITKSFLAEWEERGHNSTEEGNLRTESSPWIFHGNAPGVELYAIYQFITSKRQSACQLRGTWAENHHINSKWQVHYSSQEVMMGWIKEISALTVRYNLACFEDLLLRWCKAAR